MVAVHTATVRRAAEIVGGGEILASQLDVRGDEVKKWLNGELAVPQDIFLRCVDIVNAHQMSELSSPDSKLAPKGPA